MGELRIPVGVTVTLLGLAVSLQAVTRRIEQFTHQGAAHLVALLLQRFGQSSHAFAGPPQRRFRIAPRRRFDQRLEIRDQCRVLDDRWLASRPRPPNPLRWFALPHSLQPPPDRPQPQAGCPPPRGNAAITCRKRLRRRDQTTAAFVEKRCYCGKPLSNGFNIDHHHNIWYRYSVVNLYFTLSKVDSIISGQVLSSAKQPLQRSLGGQVRSAVELRSQDRIGHDIISRSRHRSRYARAIANSRRRLHRTNSGTGAG